MKLSTKGRYGVRAMIDLASHYRHGPCVLKDMAKRIDVSNKYLEQLISLLRTAGLVRSVRGAHGGYMLARDPKDIRVSDVIQVLEGSISLVDCIDDPEICEKTEHCAAHDLWAQIKDLMESVLESVTLQNMAERQRQKGMY